jgi:hypothetical protein
MNDDEFPRFADFADEPGALDGSKLRLDDILNQEILILGHRIRQTKYPGKGSERCLTIQFRRAGDAEMHVVFTGSSVLVEQMEKYGEKVPFIAVIKRVDRYYTMS